jgi:potassium/chloride transporter 4/5/6
MNAICTNGRMSTGGAYYLLSRSLGPATGGALGILFYIATTISGAMYILGAMEAFVISTGFGMSIEGFTIRFLSMIVLAILMLIVVVGMNYVSKAGIVFLIVTLVSIFSIFIGLLFSNFRQGSLPDDISGLSFGNFEKNFGSGYKKNSSFFVLVSIFFPACTGIMAGSNRSGDLKEPSKSIPKGTLAANLTTTVGYYIFVFLFAICAEKSALLNEDIIFVAEIAFPFKFLIHAGVIFSSLGAALQSLAGSPKLLTAIAGDDLIPILKIFTKNKLYPLALNAVLCLIAIMIGSLNAVAPIVSIFFLALYGGINAACFLLDWLGSPNWRPTWKYFHKFTALAGLILCVAIMIMTSWYFALTATLLAGALYAYIDRRTKERDWGDGIVGMRAERARDALLKLDKYKTHVKNWRPKYLALGSVNEKGEISSIGVLNLLNQLRKGTGLAIYGCVVRGEYNEKSFKEAKKKEKQLDDYLSKNKLHVFSKVVLTNDVENGLLYLIQSSGLGGLEPNTVLLSWPEEWEHDLLKIKRFVHIIDSAHTYGHVITVLKPGNSFDANVRHKGCIDIWSFYYAKGMLLLIAHLLTKARNWSS